MRIYNRIRSNSCVHTIKLYKFHYRYLPFHFISPLSYAAPGWETDLDAFPLRYSFGLLVEKDVCETFGIPSSDSEREQMVPQGSGPDYILPLCVVVLDKFDSFKIETFNITSSPPSSDVLTPNALERLLQNAVDDPLQSGDVDAALGAIMSIVGTVQQSNNTEGKSYWRSAVKFTCKIKI